MTDSPLDVQAIRVRADAATGGPWVVDELMTWGYCGPLFDEAHDTPICELLPAADAYFIAKAREDVPALCDEVGRLAAENEQWPQRLRMSKYVNDRLRDELRWALDTVERLAGESLTKLNSHGRTHLEMARAALGIEQ